MTVPDQLLKKIREVLIPTDTLDALVEQGLLELQSRLEESDVSMLACRVVKHLELKRTEVGRVNIAMDLGGSFVKLGFIDTRDHHVMMGESLALERNTVDIQFFHCIVKWICQKVADFISESDVDPTTTFVLGTTFSFPLNAKGEITTMGKGYVMADQIKGVSVMQLLQQQFNKVLPFENCKFNILVGGVVNDSIAVHLANTATNRGSDISLVLGTGINACFSLPAVKIPKKKCTGSTLGNGSVLINSEIGFMGKGFIKLTRFDPSCKPFMPLEYVTAGRWIPLTLFNILQYYNLLPENGSDLQFDGKLICQIVNRSATPVFGEDQSTVECIAGLLIERAAIYASAALLSIFKFKGTNIEKGVRIGYAGSFLHHCDIYKDLIKKFSNGIIELEFLEHSNLIGAYVNALEK
ncbi:LANO_0G13454g1_1 [Lachancea nothofagi CBS 11611]|uniref:Phosphotransferase n=1 Tax=Lachancea nothofagi CBS 11611 TaxID=1266666 RepID=A0A1G4KK09_9SACH|nr:LANO_0G13454g1_1 [Lachancea nothofagi CBS 11611]